MDIKILISKAKRGKLEPKELRELVQESKKMSPKERAEINALIRKYQSVYEKAFLASNFGAEISAEVAAEVLSPVQERLKKSLGDGAQKLGNIIASGRDDGETNENIVKVLKKALKSQVSKALTNVNTARIGINRAGTLNDALKNNVKYFKYVGAGSGIREFCRAHLNETFSIEEIRKMSNGQGLPVEYYCGGYNCRHRWIAIDDNKALLDRLKPGDFKWNEKDLKSDVWKHGVKEFGIDEKEYKDLAVNVAQTKNNPHTKNYKGVDQFLIFDGVSMVVCNRDGAIRGMYKHDDIQKTINNLKEKKLCKPIV